jgi:hypothetical protein
MVRLIRRTFFLVLAVAGTTQLSAQQTAWRVGLAQTEITPEQPMLMDGYAGRRQPFEGVESPIHAKALALADASGNRARNCRSSRLFQRTLGAHRAAAGDI